jgi:HAD superfamily hydrolase (TIGR01509 family)
MDYFDLFCFDMDGTLINTEHLNHMAYNKTFELFNIPITLSFGDYCKYAHYDDVTMENFVVEHTKLDYKMLYNKKKEILLGLYDTHLDYIPGADKFLQQLFTKKKKTCIVTYSDKDMLDKVTDKLPLLKLVNSAITKYDCINKKPNPECYLSAWEKFPDCKRPIGFEDSFKGYTALKSSGITSVYIGSPSYYYYDKLGAVNSFTDFTSLNLDMVV